MYCNIVLDRHAIALAKVKCCQRSSFVVSLAIQCDNTIGSDRNGLALALRLRVGRIGLNGNFSIVRAGQKPRYRQRSQCRHPQRQLGRIVSWAMLDYQSITSTKQRKSRRLIIDRVLREVVRLKRDFTLTEWAKLREDNPDLSLPY